MNSVIGRYFRIGAILALGICYSLHAAEDSGSSQEALAEAQVATQENALAGLHRGDSQSPEALLRGTFYALPGPAEAGSGIAGYLVTHDRTYQLKVGNERVMQELLKRKGQRVILEGEIRNQGKYFIVQRFAAALPPCIALRNRNGL